MILTRCFCFGPVTRGASAGGILSVSTGKTTPVEYDRAGGKQMAKSPSMSVGAKGSIAGNRRCFQMDARSLCAGSRGLETKIKDGAHRLGIRGVWFFLRQLGCQGRCRLLALPA